MWAERIGGAARQDAHHALIASAGLVVERAPRDDYAFVSARARSASARYGAYSVSLLAGKPR